MPRPVRFRTANLRLSVVFAIGETVTVGGVPYAIYHDYSWGDPEDIRTPTQPPPAAWVATTWISNMAGMGSGSILQMDVFSRMDNPADPATSDPMGIRADDIADELADIFIGVRPDTRLFAQVPVMDFTDPDNPVATEACIWCQNLAGQWGVPNSRTASKNQGGFQRVTMQHRFRMPTDAVSNAGFYTS